MFLEHRLVGGSSVRGLATQCDSGGSLRPGHPAHHLHRPGPTLWPATGGSQPGSNLCPEHEARQAAVLTTWPLNHLPTKVFWSLFLVLFFILAYAIPKIGTPGFKWLRWSNKTSNGKPCSAHLIFFQKEVCYFSFCEATSCKVCFIMRCPEEIWDTLVSNADVKCTLRKLYTI